MNPALLAGGFHGGASGIDIGRDASGQATDDGTPHSAGDFPDRLKVPLAGDREASLNDVDPKTG
jgi:hypothetical protein